MTDDIVTRLREKYLGQLPVCQEAADEIERLRAECSNLLIVAQKLYLWLVPDFDDDEAAKAGLDAYKEFDKLQKNILND